MCCFMAAGVAPVCTVLDICEMEKEGEEGKGKEGVPGINFARSSALTSLFATESRRPRRSCGVVSVEIK